ncbi:hypothetical protein AVEN_183365-1 [Araneus ventricosus]|uniref:Uncharacterized protein n=1 Tax=Araneus ventricosus TaxID=182803 RepID=A0A4Y2LW63_ARAVE|nr:hypothetical protein AVEN_183365-1 [Araneus ventricosus]
MDQYLFWCILYLLEGWQFVDTPGSSSFFSQALNFFLVLGAILSPCTVVILGETELRRDLCVPTRKSLAYTGLAQLVLQAALAVLETVTLSAGELGIHPPKASLSHNGLISSFDHAGMPFVNVTHSIH